MTLDDPNRLISYLQTANLDRRRFLSLVGSTAAALGLVACGGNSDGASSSGGAAADEALPSVVPPGTTLTVNNPATGLQLKLSGLDQTLPFKIPEFPNVSAGPDVINAFRANSLDISSNAGIPPIQSYFQDGDRSGGLNTKIVAVRLTRVPTYIFATKPGSTIQTTADFRGKKLAFSQGQAQGVVLLRALNKAGIKYKDVTLVELNSPQFLTALQAGQVDIAPLPITSVDAYINQYGKDGAHKVPTDVIDRLTVLWAPGKVLANPAKLAAVTAFIPIWAKAAVWVDQNQDVYAQEYYVKDQGLKPDQAKAVMTASSKPLFPPNWDEAIKWEQETIDLLAEGDFVKSFKADVLFDRRFERLAHDAVSAEYRS